MTLRARSAEGFGRGFTLIETVAVLGIVAILATISASAYASFKGRNNLEVSALGVVQAVRRAQANAQMGKGGSAWGVKIISGRVTIFKGASYDDRDAAFDQELDMAGDVTASEPYEIVFPEGFGSSLGGGAITLDGSSSQKTIVINEKGVITY